MGFSNENALIMNIKQFTSHSRSLLLTDFRDILEGQKRKPTLDGVKVLIERAPLCNSIFVSDFAPGTSQDEVQLYFENTVGPLDKARGIKFSPQWEGYDEKYRFKRAIVYFENAESE